MQDPCAICGEPSEHVDHCHKHGHVRQPLCEKCNHGLGNFRDRPDLLLKAAEYLRRHAK